MTIEIMVLCDGKNCRNMADVRADTEDAVKEAGYHVAPNGNHFCMDCAKKIKEESKVFNQVAAPDTGGAGPDNQ